MPVFLFVLVCAASAEGQIRWGARVGLIDNETMLGGDLRMRIRGSNFYFNPSVEIGSEVFTVNADVHYELGLTRNSGFWFGAGIGEVIPEGGDLGFAVRVLAGIGVAHGGNIYYTQLANSSTTAYDNDTFTTLAFGVRF